MKTLTNPQEFVNIHRNEKSFINALTNNFKMRVYISSYGFRADRKIANTVAKLATA